MPARGPLVHLGERPHEDGDAQHDVRCDCDPHDRQLSGGSGVWRRCKNQASPGRTRIACRVTAWRSLRNPATHVRRVGVARSHLDGAAGDHGGSGEQSDHQQDECPIGSRAASGRGVDASWDGHGGKPAQRDEQPAPPAASIIAIAVLSGVVVFRCDGTWRQAWIVIPIVSTTQIIAKAARRARFSGQLIADSRPPR